MKTKIALTHADDLALHFIDAQLCETTYERPELEKRAKKARATVAKIRAAFQATQQKAKG